MNLFMRMQRHYWVLLCLLVLVYLGRTAFALESILTDFVNAEDEQYSWTIQKIQSKGDLTFVVIDLKSLEWLTPKQVNRPQWQHWLELYIPKNANAETALLYIGGGRNGRAAPEYEDSLEAMIAKQTRSIVGVLGQVPNQKLIFNGDSIERREDRLLAHAWTQFNHQSDSSWIPLLPMVKSVVRAMDAISEVTVQEDIDSPAISKFVLTGGSKRGWTTWLSAVVDERVVAIVPAVFDALNSATSMQHHFKAYGFWSHAVADYFAEGLLGTINAEQAESFFQVTDPFRYREQLTLPKYIVNATGDEFFLLDSSQFYWDELKGPKYLRYVPNSDHSLEHTDAVQGIATFHWLIQNAHPIPSFEWKWTDTTTVELKGINGLVSEVNKWSSHNPSARDFRLLRKKDSMDTQGPEWRQEIVYQKDSKEEFLDSTIVIEFDVGDTGWYANLVEVVFDVGFKYPLKLTTNVTISPTTLPFADKEYTGKRHLTFNCAKSEDSDTPATVMEFLKNSFNATYRRHVEHDGRDYFNWKPIQDPRLEGAVLVGYLESKGYRDCIIQLEAGPGPTLPPESNSMNDSEKQ